MATTKMMLIRTSMRKHMKMLEIMRKGALTEMRNNCWKAFCRLFTSVVMRVTSPEVLNLSMSENEKVWILRYIASRRLLAKPVEA